MQSNFLSDINLLLAGLQATVAVMWFVAAALNNSWLPGFIGVLFIAQALASLEIWALRVKLKNEAKETKEKEAVCNVPLDQR